MKTTTTKYFKVYKATGAQFQDLNAEKPLQRIKVEFHGNNSTDKLLNTATVTTSDGRITEILSACISPTNQKGIRVYRPAISINELAIAKRLPIRWILLEYTPKNQ